MATFKEFFDAVFKTELYEAQGFMEDWRKQIHETEWEKACTMPLSAELVIAFCEGIQDLFQERVAKVNNPSLFERFIKRGHEFLQEVHAKAAQFGIDLPVEDVDGPISDIEILLAAGVAVIQEKK